MLNNIEEFEELLNRRGPFTYAEMFPWAHEWAEDRNERNASPVYSGVSKEVMWSWDCGLKIDYDGSLIEVSSRFYPPHKSHADYGKYSGTVSIFAGGEVFEEKEFEADTLEGLATAAEQYVAAVEERIKKLLKSSGEFKNQ